MVTSCIGETRIDRSLTTDTSGQERRILQGKNILDEGAVNFSLNDSIIWVGKVWPFSQMSKSFLIFSYKVSVR